MRLRELLRAPRKSGVRPSNEWVPFAHCRGILCDGLDHVSERAWNTIQKCNYLPALLLSPSPSHPQCLHHLRSGCSRGGNCPFMHTNKAGEDVMHRRAAAEIAKKLDVSQDVLATLPSCIRAVRDRSPGAMYPSKSNCNCTVDERRRYNNPSFGAIG